jgi:hypothetical protein
MLGHMAESGTCGNIQRMSLFALLLGQSHAVNFLGKTRQTSELDSRTYLSSAGLSVRKNVVGAGIGIFLETSMRLKTIMTW